ncbi:MAG: hypothetical protein PF961_23285 [Planctomycetota bacterium]|jgi:tetratricopeptide (TPR) repeat protein|nr:hypothetical protein [Planctomycetota bacterium]
MPPEDPKIAQEHVNRVRMRVMARVAHHQRMARQRFLLAALVVVALGGAALQTAQWLAKPAPRPQTQAVLMKAAAKPRPFAEAAQGPQHQAPEPKRWLPFKDRHYINKVFADLRANTLDPDAVETLHAIRAVSYDSGTNALVHRALAEIALRNGQLEDTIAEVELEVACWSTGDSERAIREYRDTAFRMSARNEFALAEEFLDRAIEVAGDDLRLRAIAVENRADFLTNRRRYTEAREAQLALAAQHGLDTPAGLALRITASLLLATSGDTAGGMSELLAIVHNDALDREMRAQALLMLAQLHFDGSDSGTADAVVVFTQVVEQFPTTRAEDTARQFIRSSRANVAPIQLDL